MIGCVKYTKGWKKVVRVNEYWECTLVHLQSTTDDEKILCSSVTLKKASHSGGFWNDRAILYDTAKVSHIGFRENINVNYKITFGCQSQQNVLLNLKKSNYKLQIHEPI